MYSILARIEVIEVRDAMNRILADSMMHKTYNLKGPDFVA
jgi:hypothetical protein